MLHIIGLGLAVDGISKKGIDILKSCKKIYLENYTVEFPYNTRGLAELLGKKKIHPANRKFVESLRIVDEAKKLDIALLVYGSPLTATTHISILDEAKKSGVITKVIHSASIFDAVGETGLQLYKFGKTASLPNLEADSYINIIKENLQIGAHTLILVDIGMRFEVVIKKLKEDSEKKDLTLKKIIVCQRLGTNQSEIFYKGFEKLEKLEGEDEIRAPFCMVVPGKMHFLEKEFLDNFK
ncbi:MAG TPA: diphthine synthase [Candidatus Pacearchaeota archaeon]|nr:diphthine synthase [Candidatus Pacearchaeota archaeon]